MTEYKNLSIKEWSVEDRPREKLVSKGISSLSDAELIAIIIGSGSRDETAVELSKRLLASVNHNLNELGKLNLEQLMRFKGIGEAKAICITATLELGRRRKLSEVPERLSVASSRDVFNIFHPILSDLPYEEFWIVLLNRASKVIDKARISQGGVAGTVTDIKLILKLALEKLASSIILVHNHPSGNLKPSEADCDITRKIKAAAAYMDISVYDHVIIANDHFYSFADQGAI